MRNRSRRGRMWLRATHNGDFAVVRGCPGYEERTMSCHSSYDSERAAGIHGDFALGSPRTVRQSLGKQENGPRNCANRSASHSPPHSEMHWNLFLVPWQGWSDNGCGWSGSGTACFQEICQSGTFRTAISHHPDMVLTLCCPLRRQAMNNNPGLNLEGHSRPACGNDDGCGSFRTTEHHEGWLHHKPEKKHPTALKGYQNTAQPFALRYRRANTSRHRLC